MFGIGGSEMLVIALVAILVFGPSRIPEVARSISTAYRELTRLRRQVGDTVSELRQEINLTAGLEDDLAQALRPPTGTRVPQGQKQSAPPRAESKPESAADPDDYLAPAANPPVTSSAADSTVQSPSDDYLREVDRGE
jgi:sec-independent protein translocase protein TatB